MRLVALSQEGRKVNHYWELKLKDGTSVKVAPTKADIVKAQMKVKGTISTQDREILFNEIESFMMTNEKYATDQDLLTAVAQAFNDPIFTDEGIKSAWVKKEVTRTMYEKHYSKLNYKKLQDGSLVTIAFVLPLHQIDTNQLDYCTDEEIMRLERG